MLYLLPFISAFIGWFTNWIAIKMLFHPRLPVNILGYKLQGIFPKRQQQFAEKLGQMVSKELISFEDIRSKINNPSTIEQAMPLVENHIDGFLKTKLKEKMPLVSMFISDNTIGDIKIAIMDELRTAFPIMLNKMGDNLQADLNIEKIVIDKVQAFSSDKLEDILNAIMKKEFVFVEIIGGVLGFLIGLLQVVLTKYA